MFTKPLFSATSSSLTLGWFTNREAKPGRVRIRFVFHLNLCPISCLAIRVIHGCIFVSFRSCYHTDPFWPHKCILAPQMHFGPTNAFWPHKCILAPQMHFGPTNAFCPTNAFSPHKCILAPQMHFGPTNAFCSQQRNVCELAMEYI